MSWPLKASIKERGGGGNLDGMILAFDFRMRLAYATTSPPQIIGT